MASSSKWSLLLTTLLLCNLSAAKDFLVGGSASAWKVPSSTSESLNKWAEANRFQIGDTLVWKGDGKKDSVLQVSREDYLSCNTSNPITASKDVTTTVKLDRLGACYFISGEEGACEKGEKVIVVVMSNKRRFFGISPAPAPAEAESPAAVPMSGAVAGRGFVGAVVLMVLGVMGMAL